MAFTTDPTTDIGKIRLLCFDRNASYPIFQDDDIEAFIALEVGVKRSAALAIETIATQQALILKVIRNLNLSTDGAKLAETLFKRAKALRDQADIEDGYGSDGLFDWAEQVYPTNVNEYINNEILRDT
jgi:hypothetical protein